MPLIYDGKILRSGGKILLGDACCCEEGSSQAPSCQTKSAFSPNPQVLGGGYLPGWSCSTAMCRDQPRTPCCCTDGMQYFATLTIPLDICSYSYPSYGSSGCSFTIPNSYQLNYCPFPEELFGSGAFALPPAWSSAQVGNACTNPQPQYACCWACIAYPTGGPCISGLRITVVANLSFPDTHYVFDKNYSPGVMLQTDSCMSLLTVTMSMYDQFTGNGLPLSTTALIYLPMNGGGGTFNAQLPPCWPFDFSFTWHAMGAFGAGYVPTTAEISFYNDD